MTRFILIGLMGLMILFLFLAGCEDDCLCPPTYEPVCGEDGETYSNVCYARCADVEIAHEGECEEEDEECICPAVYEPVCGVDGETYSNACYAECEDVEVAYEGECVEEIELEMSATEGGTTTPQPGTHNYEEGEEVNAEAIPDDGYEFDGWEREGSATECGQHEQECTFTMTENSLLFAHFSECYCPTVYEPVCGEDGETYSNECYADCAGVEVVYEGECEEDEECYCPTVYEPVCGEDGETYSNECYADCAGVEVAYEGECEEDEDVQLEMSATDGGTTNPQPGTHNYEEGEEVNAEAIPDAEYEFQGWEREGSATECGQYEEECTFTITEDSLLFAHFVEDECNCPDVYEPVCGEDGVTYSNECEAECAGVEVAYEGECEEEDETLH